MRFYFADSQTFGRKTGTLFKKLELFEMKVFLTKYFIELSETIINYYLNT